MRVSLDPGRFLLSPAQTTWTIGRCPPVDIRAGVHLRIQIQELGICGLFLLVDFFQQFQTTAFFRSRDGFQEACPGWNAMDVAMTIDVMADSQANRQGCFTFLQDLGSAHGTLLNGQKLLGTLALLLLVFPVVVMSWVKLLNHGN